MYLLKGMAEMAAIQIEKEKLTKNIDIFKRSGLDKEARTLLAQYNKLIVEMGVIASAVEQRRRQSTHALLACFIAADLATLAADQFSEVVDEVSERKVKNDDEFVRLMKTTADECATKWNEIVKIFDEGVESFNMSMYYSDFSERITDKLLPMLNDSVWDVMNTKKGKDVL